MAHHLLAPFTGFAILVPFVLIAAIYFLPLIIAVRRRARSKVGIGLVNFLFGWTVLGWIASLIWAYTDRTEYDLEREREQQQMMQMLANQNRPLK